MNFLAHLLLSGNQPDWVVGGFLGDFVKGPLKGECPIGIESGIQLHRKIDRFTDQHSCIKQCRQFFSPDMRRYAGIITDISFDHFLAKHWHLYDDRELADFNMQALGILNTCPTPLPTNAQAFIERMTSHNILMRYSNADAIPPILKRTAQRLSRPTPLLNSGAQFFQHYEALEDQFFQFFPALQKFSKQTREELEQHFRAQ